MRRTQLYLHEDTWEMLHIQARKRGSSISELVRQAVRHRYGGSPARRREAMQALVGIWKDRKDLRDSRAYVRRLRRGKRLARIAD
jgi:ribbon-helix-helix CopG family protein